MDDHELAAKLIQDHFTATAALIALMLKNPPDDGRARFSMTSSADYSSDNE